MGVRLEEGLVRDLVDAVRPMPFLTGFPYLLGQIRTGPTRDGETGPGIAGQGRCERSGGVYAQRLAHGFEVLVNLVDPVGKLQKGLARRLLEHLEMRSRGGDKVPALDRQVRQYREERLRLLDSRRDISTQTM